MKSFRLVGKSLAALFAAIALFVTAPLLTQSDEPAFRVLSLTKSSGYEHQVIKRENNELGLAEKVLMELAAKNNFQIVITKDASTINADQLKQFDVVHFYTTADLCERGGDKNPPMSEAGREALLAFVRNGGGFAGTHTTTDTFHNYEPYLKMVGAEFKTHGNQQKAEMIVHKHDITKFLGDKWVLVDEYYQFKNMTNTFVPLLTLNTKSMEQDIYTSIDPYPITWCEKYGDGRVFNTSLGHRADVWTNPKYQELVLNGFKWAAGKL